MFLRRLFRTHHYLVFKMKCSDLVIPHQVEGEEFVVIDAYSILYNSKVCDALCAMSTTSKDYLDDVRRNKAIALVIMFEEKVVHYSYVFLRNKTSCILGLRRDTALVGNDFTIPSYRGKGCQLRSVALRASIAKEHGFAYIAAETSPDNNASQRGLQNGGMNLLGSLRIFVILNSLIIRWHRPYGFPLIGFCI